MKILLINPPNIEDPLVEANMVPIGLVSINEYLNSRNIYSSILNLFYSKDWNQVRTILSNEDFSIIGITCFTRQRFSVLKLAEICKDINKNSIIVLGGPHSSFLDFEILNRDINIDIIVRGAGEFIFYELTKAIILNNSIDNVPSISYRRDGQIIRNSDTNCNFPINNLPLPLYDKDELEVINECEALTFHFTEFSINEKMAPLIFSRGCNNNCTFCCNGAYWKTQEYYSFEQIINQIDYYHKELGITFFDVYDDNLLDGNKQRVEDVLKYLIRNNYKIIWWCSTKLDSITIPLIPLLKRAGCFMISIGIESGSEKVLKEISKNINLNVLPQISKEIKINDLQLRITISIGHPNETIEDIEKTINLINLVKPTQIAVFLLKVYPGTPLHKLWLTYGNKDSYWFNPSNDIVPFYTESISLEELLNRRDYLVSSIKAKVLRRLDSTVFTVELFLDWSL